MHLVDIDGLSLTDPYSIADTLGGELIDARLVTLMRTMDGYGVTVVTGPWGCEFWTVASPEVSILVEPDGYKYEERWPLEKWAAVQCGVPKGHADKGTGKKKWAAEWSEAADLITKIHRVKPLLQPLVDDPYPVEIIDVEEICQKLQAYTTRGELVSLDYEWRDDGELTSIQAADANHQYYAQVQTQDDVQRIRFAVDQSILGGLPTVWHNGRSDIGSQHRDPLRLFGCDINDTLICAYLIGETGNLGLKPLTRKYLGREPVEFPGQEVYATWPIERKARYAGADVRNCYDLFRIFYAKLVEMDMVHIYEQFEKPLIPIVADMEQTGSPVDIKAAIRLRDRYERYRNRIRKLYPNHDISKPTEIRRLISERSGFDPGSIAKPVLAKINERYVEGIRMYRRATTLEGFLDGHIERADGRDVLTAYPSFNQAGSTDDGQSFKSAARTGRFTSSGPFGNFENQPRAIREIFIAP